MKIYDARYERTYKVADYESEKFALSAVLDEGESAVETFTQMKAIVAESFGGKSVAVEKSSTNKAPAAKATKETAPKETPKAEPVKEEAVKETKEAAPAKEEKVKEEKPAKEKRVAAPKVTNYVRENDDHRGKLGSLLDEVCPKWRENPKSKEAAKLASSELEGREFIDDKGNFVESFLAEVKKRMSPFMSDDL